MPTSLACGATEPVSDRRCTRLRGHGPPHMHSSDDLLVAWDWSIADESDDG